MRGTKAMAPFLWVWGIWSLVIGVAVLFTDQLELHRAMHPWRSPALDAALGALTHVADGWVPTILALLLLVFRDRRSFLFMGLSCGISAIVVQVLKRWFDHDRPFMFKEQLGDMHWVAGLDLHHHLSFPSGHTTAAFSMCFVLAVLVGRRSWAVLLALLAALLAHTRVHLSQHFTEDVLAGAAIGTITAVAVHHWLYRSAFAGKPWLDRRLFT
ncbi:MAG: phosphatase PAP2 family protein [Flavobacteriales bacterium]|nr:phosphatase PAP2 family protein [Flavobacteriales bacterium]